MSDNTDDTNNPDTTDDTGDTGDTGDDDSLWSSLKNKVAYKIHNAATDPNANKFAAERAKKRKEEQERKKNQATESQSDTTDNTDDDPNKFSARRLAKKVGNQTLDILKKVFFPFIALMLAMIVANEAIVYSVPIRIIFFIFTFLVCFYAKPLCIILGMFYILKGGYSYYVNHMTDRPKQEIMPTIYALLPITTYKPMSSLGAFFLYPFTYPKTDEATIQLPKTMRTYWSDLEESFKDIDKVKNLPIFVDELKQIQKDLSELHNPKGRLMTFGGQEAAPPANNTNKSANQGTSNQQSAAAQPAAKPENKPANAGQPVNKPANQSAVSQKPVNKPANSQEATNQPATNIKGAVDNTMKLAAVTGQVVSSVKNSSQKPAVEQPTNKPEGAEQATNKPATPGLPTNKPEEAGQSTNKAVTPGQPTNKPAAPGQPTNKPEGAEQATNKPATPGQPSSKPETAAKPINKPEGAEQSAEKPENKQAVAKQANKPATPPATPPESPTAATKPNSPK